MAAPSCCYALPSLRVSRARHLTSSPDCCPPSSGHDRSGAGAEKEAFGRRIRFLGRSSPVILRFPPNFVRQLSTKARRNCSNIGVAQIAASSWSNAQSAMESSVPASAATAAAVVFPHDAEIVADQHASVIVSSEAGVPVAAPTSSISSIFDSDQSLTVHAGERYGRGIVTDAITTPLVRTSAYWFKNSDELIDFKLKVTEAPFGTTVVVVNTEGRHTSFEYGRYGNPTTKALEEKISALERAESTLFMASGMNASVTMFRALVPADGHVVTTTDCYRKTRIFMEEQLPKLGIMVTVIDPADMNALKNALDQGNVSLFFTESPTNPFLRCIDIELVSKLCHERGALVCIDGTFATPLNQKALQLGADLVLHSATKYIGGHNDALGGCISGPDKLVSEIRHHHNVDGGVLSPDSAYMLIRGMKTLHLRVQQQNSTALRMAQILEEHPKIARVYYPGLPSHPEHHIAKRQMTGFGGVVSFEVDGDFDATKKFIDSLKIPYLAPSFGGVESIVDQPAIMSYWDSKKDRVKYGIKDNLVRFSFGIEAFDDLKADIFQALKICQL